MAWKFTPESDTGITLIEMTGELDLEQILEALHALWHSPLYLQHVRVLCDLTSGTLANIKSSELHTIAGIQVNKRPSLPRSRIAVLTMRGVDVGISRVFEAHLAPDTADLKVFGEEADARSWLAELTD